MAILFKFERPSWIRGCLPCAHASPVFPYSGRPSLPVDHFGESQIGIGHTTNGRRTLWNCPGLLRRGRTGSRAAQNRAWHPKSPKGLRSFTPTNSQLTFSWSHYLCHSGLGIRSFHKQTFSLSRPSDVQDCLRPVTSLSILASAAQAQVSRSDKWILIIRDTISGGRRICI